MILAAYCLTLAGLAGLVAWCAATRWWHYLVMAVVSVPLFPLVATRLMGDVSRYLPPGTFSDDSSGKDEIIVVSIYSTVMLAFIFAALALWAIRIGWRLLKR